MSDNFSIPPGYFVRDLPTVLEEINIAPSAVPVAAIGVPAVVVPPFILTTYEIEQLRPKTLSEVSAAAHRCLKDLKAIAVANQLDDEASNCDKLEEAHKLMEEVGEEKSGGSSLPPSGKASSGGGAPDPPDDPNDWKKRLWQAWEKFCTKLTALCQQIWDKVKIAALEAWRGFWNGGGKWAASTVIQLLIWWFFGGDPPPWL